MLLSQGTFSWRGPELDPGPPSEGGAAEGSLLLHTLNLHIHKVAASKTGAAGALPIAQTGIRDVCVSARQGSLVVVVGKVGCGKSSLLAALTGELNR